MDSCLSDLEVENCNENNELATHESTETDLSEYEFDLEVINIPRNQDYELLSQLLEADSENTDFSIHDTEQYQLNNYSDQASSPGLNEYFQDEDFRELLNSLDESNVVENLCSNVSNLDSGLTTFKNGGSNPLEEGNDILALLNEEYGDPSHHDIIAEKNSRKRKSDLISESSTPKYKCIKADVTGTIFVPSPSTSTSSSTSGENCTRCLSEQDKKTIRNIKNNEASKRYRDKERSTYESLLRKEAELEKRNAKLKRKLGLFQKEFEIFHSALSCGNSNKIYFSDRLQVSVSLLG